ncbi:MAG: inositol 2-dehydrogenase [Acutalibacteraceae bacterium]|jgi:myo-inositol 2-dehydrogenase/D-chiro-inositol 1-dehydrogenase
MVKIGIIGAGRIGKVHLQSIAYQVKNALVKSVADPFMDDETRAFIEGMGVTEIYGDYKKILEDKEIDAVLICSSTDTHSSISVEAINAGKHVFCEKPVDRTITKILEVQNALIGKTTKFQVGFNRRFDHNFAAVRAAVDAGRIGDPHIIKITSRDPAPPNPKYIKASGGMFLDMTIHDFDMACFLSNSSVSEVYVESAVLVDPAIGEQGDVDTAVVTLRMANGALCVIDNSRKAAYGYDQRAEVFGSLGMVATSNDTLSTAVVSDENGVTGEKPLYFFLERYMQSFSQEMVDFVSAIENNTPVPVGIEAGLESVKIALAAKKSVLLHRPVKLSEIEG